MCIFQLSKLTRSAANNSKWRLNQTDNQHYPSVFDLTGHQNNMCPLPIILTDFKRYLILI